MWECRNRPAPWFAPCGCGTGGILHVSLKFHLKFAPCEGGIGGGTGIMSPLVIVRPMRVGIGVSVIALQVCGTGVSRKPFAPCGCGIGAFTS